MPRDKMPRYQEIIERYGSIAASPWKIDTANFMLETCHGVWVAQVSLKCKAPSKKRRIFAVHLHLQFVDGVEGRFGQLLPVSKLTGTLH